MNTTKIFNFNNHVIDLITDGVADGNILATDLLLGIGDKIYSLLDDSDPDQTQLATDLKALKKQILIKPSDELASRYINLIRFKAKDLLGDIGFTF